MIDGGVGDNFSKQASLNADPMPNNHRPAKLRTISNGSYKMNKRFKSTLKNKMMNDLIDLTDRYQISHGRTNNRSIYLEGKDTFLDSKNLNLTNLGK